MNKAFDIDVRKYVLMLFPSVLRKPVLYHLTYCLVKPIVTIYRSFYLHRNSDNLYAQYDSSYGNIKRLLNKVFVSEVGSFEVNPASTTDVEYKKVYITTTIGDDSAIVGQSYIDKPINQKLFDVVVPSDLTDKATQISNVVSRYALPGYGFNIK